MAKKDDLLEVEHYAALVNAWFGTRLEYDKNVLTLSAGGIGLLLTLLTAVGISTSESVFLYSAALISFLISLVCILIIFKRNSTYLEKCIQNTAPASEPSLMLLDNTALAAFGIGVLFTTIIALSTAVQSYTNHIKEEIMANDKKLNDGNLWESFTGAPALKPQAPSKPDVPAPSSKTSQPSTPPAPTPSNAKPEK